MRRVALVLMLTLGSTPAWAAWSYATTQKTQASPGGANSQNIAYPANMAANSVAVAVIAGGGSTDNTTPSGCGLTWTRRNLVSGDWAFWEAPNASGGPCTVNFANGSGMFGQNAILEWDGGSAGFESSNTGSGTSGTASVGSFSTTSGDLLIYPVKVLSSSPSGMTCSGFTDAGTTGNGVIEMWWTTSSGTTSSGSCTLQFSDTWSAAIIAEKTSGGGGGATPGSPTKANKQERLEE